MQQTGSHEIAATDSRVLSGHPRSTMIETEVAPRS
jgi:hypothetical protein